MKSAIDMMKTNVHTDRQRIMKNPVFHPYIKWRHHIIETQGGGAEYTCYNGG